MHTFNVPAKAEVSANNQAIFDQLEKALGMVPNLYAAMAHSEHALGTYLQFQNAPSAFSRKEREAVNLIVSQCNACRYCQSAHTLIGKMNGFSEEQIISLRNGEANWDSKLDSLVKLAKVITENRGHSVSDELSRFYAEGYSKGQLVELTLLIADKVVMNYLHNITQIPIDFPLAQELEAANV